MKPFSTPLRAIATACLMPGLFLWTGQAAAAPEMIDVDGGRIAYETCGTGPETLVLIHDGILDSSAFDSVWPGLCETFRVIRYDRRGYGTSPAATAPYDAVADLAAVMRANGTDKATLVGSSAGGGVAVEFALTHPEAVDRLVLVGAAVNGFRPSEHFMRRMANLIALLSAGRLEDALRDPYILTPQADAARAEVAADLIAHPGNFGAGRMMKTGPDIMPRLGEIGVPTLIVTGEVDAPDVHAHAGALEALIPGARRIVMPEGGHFIYLERPTAFVEMVRGFAAP